MGEPLNHIHQDTKLALLIAVCKRSLKRASQWGEITVLEIDLQNGT